MISSSLYSLPSEPFLTEPGGAVAAIAGAEASYEVLDAIPADIALLDEHGTVAKLNRAAREFAACDPGWQAGIVEGGSFFAACEAAGEEARPYTRKLALGVRLVIAGYKPEFSLVYPCVAGPEKRWFQLVAKPVTLGGRPGAVLKRIDVTRDQIHQEMLVRALRATRRAVEVKTKTFAGINHDLRAPLNAIIGFSAILKSGYAGEMSDKQREYVGLIHESGKHLLEVAEAMLNLSRLEADHLEVNEARIELAPLVGSCLDMLREPARQRRQRMTAEIAPDLPPLMADEAMLRRMVVNLLNNAAKYSGDDAAITVRVWADLDGLWLAVADNGPGIPRDKLELVCRPYQRGDVGRVEGVGLGLALVRSMVEAHGGSFTLASTEGQGTTATLWFPPERIVREIGAGRPDRIGLMLAAS